MSKTPKGSKGMGPELDPDLYAWACNRAKSLEFSDTSRYIASLIIADRQRIDRPSRYGEAEMYRSYSDGVTGG